MKWKASLTGVSGESRRDFFSSSMEAHLFSSDCRTRLCWTCCGWEEEVGGWCTHNMNEWVTRWMIHTKPNACREKLSMLWNISSSRCCGVSTLDSDSLWSAVVISGQGILTPDCVITAAGIKWSLRLFQGRGFWHPAVISLLLHVQDIVIPEAISGQEGGGIDAWLSSSLLLHVRDIVIPEAISGQEGVLMPDYHHHCCFMFGI